MHALSLSLSVSLSLSHTHTHITMIVRQCHERDNMVMNKVLCKLR